MGMGAGVGRQGGSRGSSRVKGLSGGEGSVGVEEEELHSSSLVCSITVGNSDTCGNTHLR